MARAWRAPSPAFRRLAHEGLRRHLTTLSRCLPEPASVEAVREAIAAAYAETLGAPLVPGTVSAAEARAVARAEAELGSEAFVRDGDGARGAGLKIARGVFVYEGRDAASGVCVSVRTRDGRIDALAVRGAGARAARRLLGREVGGAAGPNPADVIARALGAARTGGRPCVTAS
jgi:hypothetical protein